MNANLVTLSAIVVYLSGDSDNRAAVDIIVTTSTKSDVEPGCLERY